MTTLESLLKARVAGDARAHVGVVEIVGGSTRILFGALGDLGRVILSVSGNDVSLVYPALEGDAARDFALANIEGDETVAAAQVEAPRSDADISRDVHLAAFGSPVTITKVEPPDPFKGEWVDDKNPLQPGENPEDALDRLEATGGESEPRAGDGAGAPNTSLIEQINEGTGINAPDANEALSEVKGREDGASDPHPTTDSADAGAAAAQDAQNGDAGGNAPTETETPADDAGSADSADSADSGKALPAPVDPKAHNVAELKALAEAEGVKLTSSENTKAEIAAAINKARGH